MGKTKRGKYIKNQHPHTITINGKRYSASTGKPLENKTRKSVDSLAHASGSTSTNDQKKGDSKSGKVKTPGHPKSNSITHPKTIDGLSRSHHQQSVSAHHIHRRTHSQKVEVRDALGRSPSHARPPITKPSAPIPNKKAETTKKVRQNKKDLKDLSYSITKEREKRARKIARSGLVSKFTHDIVGASSMPLSRFVSEHEIAQPVYPDNGSLATTHKPNKSHHMPPAYTPLQPDINKKSKHRAKLKKHMVSASAAVASVLLFGGYLVYLNAPNMALRVAASRAGVSATMPSYSPKDYRLARPINYRDGVVVLYFNSAEGGLGYSVSQESSDLDSRSLLENHILPRYSQYETYQDRGVTVYVYNDSDATWVNGGIRYTIDASAELEPDQILKIATSL